MSNNSNSSSARTRKLPALRRHKKGTGTVRLSGQDHYLGAWPKDEPAPEMVLAKYNELLARWIAGGRKPLLAAPGASAVLVKDIVDGFLKACPVNYPKGSLEPVNFELAMRPLVALHGLTAAADFRPKHLEEVRAEMFRRGWARGHINRSVNRVKRAFKWAVRTDLIPVAVYDALRTVEAIRKGLIGVRESPRRKPATEAQVDAICRELSGPMSAMFRLLWLTGMRPGEVRRMRAEEIDQSGEVWVYRPAEHKTSSAGEIRSVAMGPMAIDILRPWLELVPAKWGTVFHPRRLVELHMTARANERDGNVLSDRDAWAVTWWSHVPGRLQNIPNNDQYTSTGFSCSVRTAAKKANLPKGVSAYCCRHAVRMRVGKSHGDEAARAVLGQRHIETTALYGRIDEDSAKEVMGETG